MRPTPAPVESIVALLRDLVRIASRAGEDELAPVLHCIENWLRKRDLAFHTLRGPAGEPLGLYAELQGGAGPGRWTVLDATLDTAGFGNPASWARPPTSAAVEDGWLHGRGSADSKAGVAVFAHLLHEFSTQRARFAERHPGQPSVQQLASGQSKRLRRRRHGRPR